MASLLAFAFRRRNSSETIPESSGTILPPEVSATVSADSASTTQADENSSFVTAMEVPRTPDGLRPRQSLQDLMVQLDVPVRVTPMATLPPRHPLASPQISTSSFYTRTTAGTLVAESPDLSVGRARTAVGALVAQQQPLPVQHSVMQHHGGEMGVLPPRDWLQEERGDGEDMIYHRLDDSLEVLTPSRARRSFMSDNSVSSTVDASSIHPSPSTWRHYQQYQDESYEQVQHRHDVNISFSSRLGLVEDGAQRDSRPYNFNSICGEEQRDDENYDGRREFVVSATDHLTNVSGISQSTTGPSEKWTWGVNEDIDSSPEDGYSGQDAMDNALLQRKALNQRRRKERLVLDLVQRLQDNTEMVAEVEDLHDSDESLNRVFLKTPMDRESLLVGYGTEKRVRLLNTIAQLLHEMDVAQPEEFFMSPTNIPEIADTHHDLRQALTFLHSLVYTAVADNEQGHHHGTFGPTTNIAPPEVKPRWAAKGWLRNSLGLGCVPESPESIRGGDTSLFSLPSESCDTPHTSNVSMATTITSRHSTAIVPYEAYQTSKLRRTVEITATLLQKLTLACDQLLVLERSSSKESIMATEEIKRNYLQLMSLPLAEMTSLVSAFSQELPPVTSLTRIVSEDDTENIDKDVVPVSPPRARPSYLPNETALTRPVVAAEMERGGASCSRSSSVHQDYSRDFFSPATEDMDSRVEDNERDYGGYIDDLRRDVGSYDCDEREGDDCEREGPDETFSSEDISHHVYGHDNSGAFPSILYEALEQPIHNACMGEV